jgi:hypothetical protein
MSDDIYLVIEKEFDSSLNNETNVVIVAYILLERAYTTAIKRAIEQLIKYDNHDLANKFKQNLLQDNLEDVNYHNMLLEYWNWNREQSCNFNYNRLDIKIVQLMLGTELDI